MRLANLAVALFCTLSSVGWAQFAPSAAQAQTPILDELFSELQSAGPKDDWRGVEKKIWQEWSKSGSASMDLLLQRGRREMERGNLNEAIAHFSALIDHAPEFAEGWNARATAFFAAERFGLSMFDIEQTLRLNPRHFGAMSGLGMIMERLDRPEEALTIYRKAEEVHPHRPDVKDAIQRLEIELEGETL